jgi:casein kinase II subunit beta
MGVDQAVSDIMSSSSPPPESWISSFCSLLGHEYFAEVSEDFIEDDFNLTGLQSQVPMYKEALEMILDVEPEDEDSIASDEEDEEEEEEEDDDDDPNAIGEDGRPTYRRAGDHRRAMRVANDLSVIEGSAEMLYGLIHQRFITSRPGIQQMAEKYALQHFGVCPRVLCNGCRVLPVGHSDTPGQDTVKLFCPSCLDIYTPPNSRFQSVDGAFFGTTFGCLFFMTFPELDVGAKADSLTAPTASSSASAATQNNGTSGASDHKGRGSSIAALINNAVPPNSGVTSSELPRQPTMINGTTPANLAPGLGSGTIYEPRIYGFKVSERAKSGPRMKWLRSKPDDINELNEARLWHQANDAAMSGDDDDDDDLEDTEMAGVDGQAGGGAGANTRKKASVRRRRGDLSGKAEMFGGRSMEGSPMDTNGVGDGV